MAISLGNFSTLNGRNVLTGISGSGLDTEGLITGLTDARRLPATQLEDRITVNDSRVAAYGELRTLLSSLKDAANFLRNPPGVQNEADNVFQYRSAALSSSTSVAASTYLSVSAQPGASVQNYNITEITSLAAATKQRTGTISVADADTSVVKAGATPGFFKAGTVTINGADITLDEGDTLNQVVAAFNAEKTTTGIEASIIQSGTGAYTISFTATATGTANAFDLNDIGTVTADPDNVFGYLNSTNIVTNGTFDSDIAGYTDASLGTGAISYDSSGQRLVLDGDGAGGNEAFAQQALTTVIGREYTVTLDVESLENSAFVRIGTDGDVSLAANSDIADFEITEDGTATFTFTATDTTTYLTINSDTNTAPFTVDNISVVDNSDITNPVTDTQTASDAEFVIDGVTVTRSTNTITDAIDDLTFTLLQETPALTEIGVDIAADTSLPLSGASNFITAFNNLRIFVAEQTSTNDDGTFTDEAVLAAEGLLRNITSSLSSELSASVSGAGTYTSLSQIGITFADLPESEDNPFTRNILNVDTEAFNAALAADFDSVQDLFGLSFTTDNSLVGVFQSTNTVTASSIALNIDPGAETFEAVVDGETYTLDATEAGTSGYTLKGQAGTPLEGLTLVYASTSAGTANVTISQGIAARIFNDIDSILDEQEGSLELEISSIEDSNTRLEAEIERIDDQVERYRESLIRQFSALEALLSSVNNLLDSLETQQLVQFGN